MPRNVVFQYNRFAAVEVPVELRLLHGGGYVGQHGFRLRFDYCNFRF